MLRCLIVDDSPAFLEAATHLLQREGLSVAGEASTAAAAVAAVAQLHPDVVLLDVSLGEESGFEVARQLADTGAQSAVILISTHAESDLLDLLDDSPSVGFLPKAKLSAAAVRRLANAPRGT